LHFKHESALVKLNISERKMNDEHIGFSFVKTKSLEQLKAEFSSVPAERIKSVEYEYKYEYGSALLREARIDNFTGNFLKLVLLVILAALTVFALMNFNWFFTPFTFGKIFLGLFFGIFTVFPTLLMSFVCYLISVLIVSKSIKFVFFNKQSKFLEKLRKIKADIDYEKNYQIRLLEIEKQQLIKNKEDSIIRDIETIRAHFSYENHTPLLSDTKLENSVSDIFNTITQWAIDEAKRKDKTDSYKNKKIENDKKLLFLLAQIEEEQFVEKVNKLVKLMSLVNPDDHSSDFSKSLLIEIKNLTINDPKLLRHTTDALRRYEQFLKKFEIELKTQANFD
jgi:hypothetical protein